MRYPYQSKGIKNRGGGMCEKTRRFIQSLPATRGAMNEGSKDAIMALLDEIEALSHKQDNLDKRLTTIETATAETLKLVVALNDKINVDKVEEKAAQLDLLTKFASSKIGKIILIVSLVALIGCGLSIAYLVEHSNEVSQITQSVRSK